MTARSAAAVGALTAAWLFGLGAVAGAVAHRPLSGHTAAGVAAVSPAPGLLAYGYSIGGAR